jgi:RHS repeat-associated protein
MTSAILPNGQSVGYAYDALGRRASRTAGGQTTSFLYDGADVVLDRASDGSSVDYLNGARVDDKLRLISSSGGAGGGAGASVSSHYFLQDHLGSTIALTDTNGGVIERQEYEPFGASSGSALTRYGYTGRERDEATGLMDYRARWYDPQQARFISEDPIGFQGGLNFYAYVGENPINYYDAFGLARLYYWALRLPGRWGRKSWGLRIGHIAIRLDDGTYISFFPGRPGKWHKDYLDDVNDEDRQATRVYEVEGLDEMAIKKWFENYKKNLPNYIGIPTSEPMNVCSDVVGQALRAGGLDVIERAGCKDAICTPGNIEDALIEEAKRSQYPEWKKKYYPDMWQPSRSTTRKVTVKKVFEQ